MTYKAIVLDLDGTLTNNKKEITPKTREALLSAQRNGMHVILASGRPTYGIRPLADELQIGQQGGYVMAYNGGCVTQWGSKAIIFNQTLNADLVPILYRAAKEDSRHFEILTYQGEGIAATDISNEYVRHEAFINKMPLTQYDDFVHQVQHPIYLPPFRRLHSRHSISQLSATVVPPLLHGLIWSASISSSSKCLPQ